MKRRRECRDEREVGDEQREFGRDAQRFTLVDALAARCGRPGVVGGVSGKDFTPDGARPLAPIRGAPVHVAVEARNRRLAQPDSAVPGRQS